MSEAERQDVIDRLKAHSARINGLMNFLADRTRLSPEQKAEAQEMMKAIKEALEVDYRKGATVSGRESLNEWEAAYLDRAVHQASCQIKARWNSDPIQSRWFDQLYAAHIDIDYPLHQLENPREKTA